MEKKTLKIAFYGKGGIGKSTIAANVSGIMAQMGKKVLHIGCDPKADAARCLTGKKIPTVLSQMERLGESTSRADLIFPGRLGISCMEAGGPSAGMGCAGMGITAMQEELERLAILEEDWDVVVYDVLGDVVCGGFSVPMRKHYADAVYIVSSSDFMSIYAANNILKAVDFYGRGENALFGGLIWNHQRSDWDIYAARSFAEKTRTEIVGFVEESEHIKWSDYENKLVIQEKPGSPAALQLKAIALQILKRKQANKGIAPCTDEELELWREQIRKEKR